MTSKIFTAFSVVATLTLLVLPIRSAAAQSTNPPGSTVVSGGNPEPDVVSGANPDPQILLLILLSTIPAA